MTSNIDSLIQDMHALTKRSPAALQAVFERLNPEQIDE